MSRYKLRLEDAQTSKIQEFDFDDEDPHPAFSIVERIGGGHVATVWDGDNCLGRLRYSKNKIWEVS